MCECTIGLLSRGYDGCELVTLSQLKERIAEKRHYNEVLVPTYATGDSSRLIVKVWQLRDYGDFRKSTDLTRFKHCPYCGKEISWKEIRSMEDVECGSFY